MIPRNPPPVRPLFYPVKRTACSEPSLSPSIIQGIQITNILFKRCLCIFKKSNIFAQSMGNKVHKGKQQTRYQGIAISLLLIFMLYWAGISLFTHSHVVNGVVIVHSHPFSTEHTHSAHSLETILFHTGITVLTTDLQSFRLIVLFVLLAIFLVPACSSASQSFVSKDNLLRGPPASAF